MNITKRYTIRTLCLVLLILCVTSACQPRSEESRLVYGLTLSPSGIDPHLNASAELGIPLQSVYDTLVVRHPETGEFLPSLASNWDISSDGRTYTFVLRQDVTFHDGSLFDAEAVVANIDYILDPEHYSQKAAAMLGPTKDAIALDTYTVQIRLEEPFSPLLDSLSQVYLGMASQIALEQYGPGEYQFHQVGTGPYRFIAYSPDEHIILERYPDYAWGPSIYKQKSATIDQIEFRFFEDEATRALALERGEVDIIGEVPPQDALRLSELEAYKLHTEPIPGQPLQFFLNTQIEPTSDLLVRQALIAAVDRERIVRTVFGDLSPVSLGPLSLYPFAPIIPDSPLPKGIDLANQLLDEAGWNTTNMEGIREKNQEELHLRIVSPPWGSNPEVAQLIKADWERVGAQVEIEVVSAFGPLKESADGGDYHAIGLNFFGTDADLLRTFFQSDGFYNWSRYTSAQLDDLLGLASIELDLSMRNNLYRQAIQLIHDQALILPVRDYVNIIVHRQSVSNLHFSAQGWFPYLIDLKLD